ncbi:hypothetical protein [Blastococcus sp. LR1]|uniref:hypothetical protein n=1 Tax=Blastococcus sp. LR1 TaxID=2877000 RepID=UPI001CCCB462|nr:hypothetical protein [Blastococcus sp. LR1]MCA0146201.1 hypothetical protein [Blastococcus sp. LR1]
MRFVPRSGVLCSLAVAAAVALSLLAVPAAPALAEEVPDGATVVGELVQAWPEYLDEDEAEHRADDGLLSWIEPETGDAVRIATADLAEIEDAQPGATLEVTVGAEVEDSASREDGLDEAREVVEAAVVEQAPAPAPAPGTAAAAPVGTTNAVTVVLVRPGGAPADSRTPAQVTTAVDGAVKSFWSGESGSRITVGVAAAHNWISTTADCSRPHDLWNEAAAAVGWTRGAGRHLLLYLSSNAPGCADGLAEVGWGPQSGGRLYVRHVTTSILAHELGHNFGLGHSSLLQCDAAVDSGTCMVEPYFDWYDVMGVSWEQVGSLNVAQADLIGVLPAAQQRTARAFDPGATVRLTPMSGRSGVRGLRLVDSLGYEYWLEYRTATGRDSWLGTAANRKNLQPGVQLRLAEPGADTSLLLDGTPSAAAGWAADLRTSLPEGQTLALADGDLAVRVVAVASGYADVRISTLQGTAAIDAAVAAMEEPARLGGQMEADRCDLPRGGCVRRYAEGAVHWSATTGARYSLGHTYQEYAAGGGATGPLGYPVTDGNCTVAEFGCVQFFENGALVRPLDGGLFRVAGAVGTKWKAVGAENGLLGYPVGNERCGLRDGGCFQQFEGGTVHRSAATGARVVRDVVLDGWGRQGWELGSLGYPIRDTSCGLPRGGCFQQFQGGLVHWSPASGSHASRGAIGRVWAGQGWEGGFLGYPTSGERCVLPGGGCYQLFQGGSVYWSPASGAQPVRGAIRDSWASMGWERSTLGYPVSAEVCGLRDGGCFQRFQGGSMYWSGASGAQFVIPGGIYDAWAAQGWERGSLGYPVAPPGGIRGDGGQLFQGGRLYWDSWTGRTTRFAR